MIFLCFVSFVPLCFQVVLIFPRKVIQGSKVLHSAFNYKIIRHHLQDISFSPNTWLKLWPSLSTLFLERSDIICSICWILHFKFQFLGTVGIRNVRAALYAFRVTSSWLLSSPHSFLEVIRYSYRASIFLHLPRFKNFRGTFAHRPWLSLIFRVFLPVFHWPYISFVILCCLSWVSEKKFILSQLIISDFRQDLSHSDI